MSGEGAGKAARGLVAVFILATGVALHREGADFSWEYHNDEPSKVRQVLEGWRNHRHPPLMLDVVVAAHAVLPGLEEPQAVVEWGRGASALYGAAAVALMADAAWMAGGPLAGLGVGLVLLTHGPSYEMAHYFKEDSLFLFGLAMMLHALVGMRLRPGPGWGGLWLLAGWVLVGAKWIGWIPWAISLPWAWRALEQTPRWRAGLFAMFFAGVLAAGARMIGAWDIFAASGAEEWGALWTGDYGAGVATPHALYFDLLAVQAHPWVWAAAGAAGLLAGCRGRLPGGLWAALNIGSGLFVLAFTAKYSERYVVPVAWLLVWFGISGAAVWTASRRGWIRGLGIAGALLLAGGVLAGQWDDFQGRRSGFSTDSRAALDSWLRTQDTEHWRLARDQWVRVGLPNGTVAEESIFAADLGTLESLRARGITHVAVCYDVYHRFVDGMVAVEFKEDPVFARREAFYRELFKEHTVVWSVPNRHPKPLHPGLTLVDIR